MTQTVIEWTHWPGRKGYSWNPWPWIGCTKVSPGCDNCYMYRVSESFGHKGDFNPEALKSVHKLHYPSTVKEPGVFFVNSMYDTWHDGIPDSSRDLIFREMLDNPQHIFLNLTKRARQMKEYVEKTYDRFIGLSNNIWLGVSVESADYMWRIEELHDSPCTWRFVSFEPLLGEIPESKLVHHAAQALDWVIVGGESDYRNPRPMNPNWARIIRDYCRRHLVPFFYKQTGGSSKCSCHNSWGCCLLDGQLNQEFPDQRLWK